MISRSEREGAKAHEEGTGLEHHAIDAQDSAPVRCKNMRDSKGS
jgi:hypothetical protein